MYYATVSFIQLLLDVWQVRPQLSAAKWKNQTASPDLYKQSKLNALQCTDVKV